MARMRNLMMSIQGNLSLRPSAGRGFGSGIALRACLPRSAACSLVAASASSLRSGPGASGRSGREGGAAAAGGLGFWWGRACASRWRWRSGSAPRRRGGTARPPSAPAGADMGSEVGGMSGVVGSKGLAAPCARRHKEAGRTSAGAAGRGGGSWRRGGKGVELAANFAKSLARCAGSLRAGLKRLSSSLPNFSSAGMGLSSCHRLNHPGLGGPCVCANAGRGGSGAAAPADGLGRLRGCSRAVPRRRAVRPGPAGSGGARPGRRALPPTHRGRKRAAQSVCFKLHDCGAHTLPGVQGGGHLREGEGRRHTLRISLLPGSSRASSSSAKWQATWPPVQQHLAPRPATLGGWTRSLHRRSPPAAQGSLSLARTPHTTAQGTPRR